MIPLTPLQKSTLDQVKRYEKENGFMPTLQILADIYGVTASAIWYRVCALIDKGYLKKYNLMTRGLEVIYDSSNKGYKEESGHNILKNNKDKGVL